MNIFNKILVVMLTGIVLLACQKEEFELGEKPSQADADFTFQATSQGENYIEFTNSSSAFLKKWDFGNGTSAEGEKVTAYFPFAGDYDVTLTVYSAGGSASFSETITIANTDPEICNVEVLGFLTGGCGMPEGKTWVIDAERAGHFGVGPPNTNFPDYYQAGANEKTGGGMYDDEYTFKLNESVFVMETNGDIYLNGGQASNFPGSFENPDVGDFTAPYTPPTDLTYALTEDSEGFTSINISPGGFIGYNTGVNSFRILSISENEMFIQFKDTATPDLLWYHRLIRKGYAPVEASFTVATSELTATFTSTSLNADTFTWDFGDGNMSSEENPIHTYAAAGTYNVTLTASGFGETSETTMEVTVSETPLLLPLDFESLEPGFTTFGGNAYAYIDNPDVSAGNGSARVMEVIHGNEPWAGQFVDLDENLDFATSTTMSVKIWAPSTGVFRLKLENVNDAGDFIEVDANIDVANQWTMLTFDVSGAVGKTYSRIVIFPGWNVPNAGTFYVDDIQFVTEPPITELTLELLTGGDTKSWILKPAAGSFGVGPSKGSDEWFPNGADISGDRPCLFNDEFIFKTGGQYEYATNGDIFGEAYMGVADGCQTDANLNGTDAEAWGSGIHSFSLTPATDTEPAYITVRGTGAFIALPKAYNGGEYGAAPPDMDAAVTYEVIDYLKDATSETLTLTIDVSAGETGGAYWSFVLIAN